MASVFKPKGKAKYVILYQDEQGRRRKKVGATDKGVTQRIAREIENRVALRREGLIDPKADAYATHEARPLSGHLDDWQRDMMARGKTARHADQYRERAGKLAALARGARLTDLETGRKAEELALGAKALDGHLRAARLSDLAPERIQSALATLRDAGKANLTVNHYRAALRAFLRWASDKGRTRDNAMRGVSGYNAEEDVRHARRSLTDDELSRLIRAAGSGPARFGMPGPLRAMAYRLATATGFRVAELRGLTPESFRLAGSEPSITLKASSTKNRRAADQPIPAALARDLAVWLHDKPAGTLVLPLHHETAKAIRGDLEAAGIPYATDEGVADFHSLRAYFVSALVRLGASIKEVQTLARHAKPQTTLNHYAKVSVRDLRGAVESLPCPVASEPEGVNSATVGNDPAPPATQDATRQPSESHNPPTDEEFAPSDLGFAKPLYLSKGIGGSNPPLSAPFAPGPDPDSLTTQRFSTYDVKTPARRRGLCRPFRQRATFRNRRSKRESVPFRRSFATKSGQDAIYLGTEGVMRAEGRETSNATGNGQDDRGCRGGRRHAADSIGPRKPGRQAV